jgi:hypothetical protein
MDVSSSLKDAIRAALKALQVHNHSHIPAGEDENN